MILIHLDFDCETQQLREVLADGRCGSGGRWATQLDFACAGERISHLSSAAVRPLDSQVVRWVYECQKTLSGINDSGALPIVGLVLCSART